MIATMMMLLSGALGALSNLCMRVSIDRKGSTRSFIFTQLFFTFLVVLTFKSLTEEGLEFSLSMALLGIITGIAFGCMKLMLIKALEQGKASLTFAAVNSMSVVPALIIALLYGAFVDFTYTPKHLLGALLVTIGLLWAGLVDSRQEGARDWARFALFACFFQILFLLFTQMHALFWSFQIPSWIVSLLPNDRPCPSCFAPIIFAAAAVMHLFLFIFGEKRFPMKEEVKWGVLGGLFNGACTFFFLEAARKATGSEHIYIFPLFSVILILLCNLWGHFLYKEKIHLGANLLCLAGLFIGS